MCNCRKGSKCDSATTKTVKKLQNRINTLIGLRPVNEVSLRQMLDELDLKNSCPDPALVKGIQDIIDNEYAKHS